MFSERDSRENPACWGTDYSQCGLGLEQLGDKPCNRKSAEYEVRITYPLAPALLFHTLAPAARKSLAHLQREISTLYHINKCTNIPSALLPLRLC